MKNFSAFASSFNRSLEIGQWPIHISGTTSPLFLAYFLSRAALTSPALVILPNESVAKAFIEDLSALAPDLSIFYCPPFDETPYSGLYPSNFTISKRCNFLFHAQSSQPSDIFVCTSISLLQKVPPLEVFKKYITQISCGDEIHQKDLITLLTDCGYESCPLVEDVATYSLRGDILDLFSPCYENPIRIEFFGDKIETIRLFDSSTQISIENLPSATIIPCKEILPTTENLGRAASFIKKYCDENGISKNARDLFLAPLKQNIAPKEFDFWMFSFFETTGSIFSYFANQPFVFFLDELEITRACDIFLANLKDSHKKQFSNKTVLPSISDIYLSFETVKSEAKHASFLNDVQISNSGSIHVSAYDVSDFKTVVRASKEAKKDYILTASEKIKEWVSDGYSCLLFSGTQTQTQRIEYLFSSHGLNLTLIEIKKGALNNLLPGAYLATGYLNESGRFLDEKIIFLRDEDFFGAKLHGERKKQKGTLEQRTNTLSFGDLSPNDFIVHTQHGIGVYEGLKKMNVGGADTEFIQLRYKDNDKLYLPIYRIAQIQKYSSASGFAVIDKLGGTNWHKTKIKVRSELKEVASELLQLYAKRQTLSGFAFSAPDDTFKQFEASFPFEETIDQLKAIDDVLSDMQKNKPMDRLVCGDVGFGKTEVAIRAAYKAVLDKKQVALLVPTTILAFQHSQTFKNRFSQEPISIAMLSRFSSSTEVKKIINSLGAGSIDIVIGTHKLLSKDVIFKDLGLLIVDEEQKFGVTHKEKIKKLKASVDVLSLSATPIPRTLNMALMGIRDLSIIRTPPDERLSIRTFVSRFNEETIRKAIKNEVARGGQVYFIHNKVQSIYDFTSRIKTLVPDIRVAVAHGQMPDEELEKTMLSFYNHEFDVLISTTIIESGLDVPRANTIIIDRADTFGLSQLYQLRGRVGRSKDRAYAYLLIPETGMIDKLAAERLKVLHEHTELGSGFKIAHHDLELRGSGNILGDDQSGHIMAVGYELYMELLDEALKQAKGETIKEEIEPEINLRIPAFIPDTYIADIRLRLGYYKFLTEINDESDLDHIEKEMVDRFGQIPPEVENLFGIMLIRKACKDLGIRDISMGPKNLSLSFTNATSVKPESVIKLAYSENKKYSITPDQKLIIRFSTDKWAPILEELRNLKNNLT